MEKRHGCLIRGMRRAAAKSRQGKTAGDPKAEDRGPEGSGARYGLFVAPRDGMGSLIAAIAARLCGNDSFEGGRS